MHITTRIRLHVYICIRYFQYIHQLLYAYIHIGIQYASPAGRLAGELSSTTESLTLRAERTIPTYIVYAR